MERYDRHSFDVIVIGAGGAGLRAAIESSASGARTALVCKSLLGKAHTVMAEGGIAAALAHGAAPRSGSAGSRSRVGAMGRSVRPHARRQDSAARVWRPYVETPRACRR